MNTGLSRRLQAVAALVPEGGILADIGTDHAFIPIALVRSGRILGALAMDINEGPLARAKAHIQAAGLSRQIITRQSDGMKQLRRGEASGAVIAGMGGGLMMRILAESLSVAQGLSYLVLQPQSEVPGVRSFLLEHGFVTDGEDMVLEDGKFYPMMRVHHQPERALLAPPQCEADLAFGALLLQSRHPVLRAYLLWERGIQERILAQLSNHADAHTKRREQVEHKLQLIDTALALFPGDFAPQYQ